MNLLAQKDINIEVIIAILKDCGVIADDEIPSHEMAEQAQRFLARRMAQAERLAILDLARLYHTFTNAKR